VAHLITGLVVVVAAAIAAPALAATNLVANGDFEAGNGGFSSDYAYTPGGNSAEGQYTTRTNPSPWNSFFVSAADHTTGSGSMFVGNGSPTDGAFVWTSGSISVNADTSYFFEAWVMNVCCTSAYGGQNSASIRDFTINGVSVGTRTTNLDKAGTWEGLSTTWDSGSTTAVVLSLVNRNTQAGGNDFAVDDIALSTQSTVTPSIPEPETYALMLAGLALVAGFARRRQSKGQAAR